MANNSIINSTPKNGNVLTFKPSDQAMGDQASVIYLENKTITVGNPMGLLLALTYPATVNFVGPRI